MGRPFAAHSLSAQSRQSQQLLSKRGHRARIKRYRWKLGRLGEPERRASTIPPARVRATRMNRQLSFSPSGPRGPNAPRYCLKEKVPMKTRILLPAFVFAIALVASSSNASAFELLDRLIGRGNYGGGCCASSCCEPSCCEPVCCEAEPVCCEAAPSCCEPSCCEPVCDPCCKPRCRPFKKFCSWLRSCHHHNHCGPSCCEPSCCEPVCCESACDSGCGCN